MMTVLYYCGYFFMVCCGITRNQLEHTQRVRHLRVAKALFRRLSPERRLQTENRYAEAFIFRRIEGGMPVQVAQKWVNQGITDMTALMDEPKVEFVYDKETKEAKLKSDL